MKTFYDIRELSPARETWRPLEVKVLLSSKRRYLIKVIISDHPRCTDLIDKYIVCPKDNFLDKDLHITESFWNALKNFLFKKTPKFPEFPEELL
jgi:hypothetical protein